jgi:hypothetical protein
MLQASFNIPNPGDSAFPGTSPFQIIFIKKKRAAGWAALLYIKLLSG